jgi:hypothetical protein
MIYYMYWILDEGPAMPDPYLKSSICGLRNVSKMKCLLEPSIRTLPATWRSAETSMTSSLTSLAYLCGGLEMSPSVSPSNNDSLYPFGESGIFLRREGGGNLLRLLCNRPRRLVSLGSSIIAYICTDLLDGIFACGLNRVSPRASDCTKHEEEWGSDVVTAGGTGRAVEMEKKRAIGCLRIVSDLGNFRDRGGITDRFPFEDIIPRMVDFFRHPIGEPNNALAVLSLADEEDSEVPPSKSVGDGVVAYQDGRAERAEL